MPETPFHQAALPPAGRKNPRTWRNRLGSASHAVTWFLGTHYPETFPLVFVVGYPKTGTTWGCQVVADYLQLPFPRYPLLPVGFEAVVHGHELVKRSYRRGVYVMRDGRDALVSQYFFMCRFLPEGDNPPVPPLYRHLFRGIRNKADTAANLPRFLEQILRRPLTSRPWHEHVRSFYETANPGVVMLRYEDLVNIGAPALAGAMARLTGEPPDAERASLALKKFSFESLSSRRAAHRGPGFLRKGRSGDWVNHFTREAAEVFDRYAGDALVQAGYEKDRAWVGAVAAEPVPPTPPVGAADGQSPAGGASR